MSFSLSLTVADSAFSYDTLSVARSDTLAAVAGKAFYAMLTHHTATVHPPTFICSEIIVHVNVDSDNAIIIFLHRTTRCRPSCCP